MGRLVVSEFVSLDGVMEGPGDEDTFAAAGWTMPYGSAEFMKFKLDELFAAGALLLGRITYDGFAAAWPGRTDDMGFAERMNTLPKYVASHALQDPAWSHSTVIGADIAAEVAAIKSKTKQDVLLFGSGILLSTLMEHNLVDEYRLLVYPVVLGQGKKLFKDHATAQLKLIDCHHFETGVTVLRYTPAVL